MRTFYQKGGVICDWQGNPFKAANKLNDRLKLENVPAPVWCEEEKVYLIGTGFANYNYTIDGRGVWVNEYRKGVSI